MMVEGKTLQINFSWDTLGICFTIKIEFYCEIARKVNPFYLNKIYNFSVNKTRNAGFMIRNGLERVNITQ